MTRSCTIEHCIPTYGCDQGKEKVEECSHWQGAAKETSTSHQEDKKYAFPWHGNAFGTADLLFVTSRGQPIVIGLVGAYNAGKTTFLASTYLLLNHGCRLQHGSFAGSYTLRGWENLAHYLRWLPGEYPQFPPHTSSGTRRMPGLLHVALRYPNHTLRDILLTDPPGEWFDRWVINQKDEEAEGARWIDQHANAFILFADCEALSGSEKGAACQKLLRLVQRLGDVVQTRPVAVIWSKSDIDVEEYMRARLRRQFGKRLKQYKEFDVFAMPQDASLQKRGSGVLETLDWILASVEKPNGVAPALPVINEHDPLLAYRGRSI